MAYIGAEPIVSATRTVTEVSATAGQTVFYPNGGYTVGKIDVIVNGAQLQSSDFTATNGSSVTLTTACSVGDDVKLVAWGTFTTANIPSGSLTSGAPTWSPTGGVSLPRIDSSTEGGQLNFNRASDDTGNWSIDSYGSGSTPSLRFIDGANVRATIDGSGNVGIGTSSPAYRLDVAGEVRANNLFRTTDGTNIGLFGSGVFASNVIGVGSSNSVPLVFGTNATERMRIDSSGNLLIGTTSVVGVGKFSILVNGSISSGIEIKNSDTGNNINYLKFSNSAGVASGYITQTGATTVAYTTSSDYRLKENIQPMINALSVVAQLKPVTYTWKVDGSEGQGFIAHELQEVVPDCVTGEKDAVDAEGKPVYQGIDTSFLVATLTAAIQELKSMNDDLKARIETLEGAKIV